VFPSPITNSFHISSLNPGIALIKRKSVAVATQLHAVGGALHAAIRTRGICQRARQRASHPAFPSIFQPSPRVLLLLGEGHAHPHRHAIARRLRRQYPRPIHNTPVVRVVADSGRAEGIGGQLSRVAGEVHVEAVGGAALLGGVASAREAAIRGLGRARARLWVAPAVALLVVLDAEPRVLRAEAGAHFHRHSCLVDQRLRIQCAPAGFVVAADESV